jgi:hypothetical protein
MYFMYLPVIAAQAGNGIGNVPTGVHSPAIADGVYALLFLCR